MRYMMCQFFYFIFIHKLKSVIQLDLEGKEENREP